VQAEVGGAPGRERLHLAHDQGERLVSDEGVDARLLVRSGFAPQRLPEEPEAVIDVGQAGLGWRQLHTDPSDQCWQLGQDGFGLGARAAHQDDEVVGEADQPVSGLALAP
jgi:hypothetical protein